MLITKRLGASGGVADRQLATRSVRSSTNNTRDNKPTDKALTCNTENPGRAANCRVAMTKACQRPAEGKRGTSRRKATMARAAKPAKNSKAMPNPPTVIRPRRRSDDTANKRAVKLKAAAANTPKENGRGLPTSRRITRRGGTCANCRTGGKPKPMSSTQPKAAARRPGCRLALGSDVFTSPANKAPNPWCTSHPTATPKAQATTPTNANSSAYRVAISR